MENIAITDAGPLIALFDKSDKYHQRAKHKLERYRKDVQGKLVTTWAIVTETTYVLKEHVHLQAELDFLKWITLEGVEMFDLTHGHVSRIIELQQKYSNIPMDFADATLVVAAESLSIDKVFSVDKDFLIYRILGKKQLKNLMFTGEEQV